MNFSQFLNESAIMLTKDMKTFSDLLVDKLANLCYSYVTFPYFSRELNGKIILTRDIESDFGTFSVKVVLKVVEDVKNEAVVDVDKKEIVIYIDKKNYNSFKNKDKDFLTEFKKIVRHELIHIVDPKLNKPELSTNAKGDIKNLNLTLKDLQKRLKNETDPKKREEIELDIDKNYDKYFKFPWEVDAFISTESEEVFEKILKKSRNKKDAYYYLKTLEPTNNVQKFYKKDQKLWKRFVLHINKLIEKEFSE